MVIFVQKLHDGIKAKRRAVALESELNGWKHESYSRRVTCSTLGRVKPIRISISSVSKTSRVKAFFGHGRGDCRNLA